MNSVETIILRPITCFKYFNYYMCIVLRGLSMVQLKKNASDMNFFYIQEFMYRGNCISETFTPQFMTKKQFAEFLKMSKLFQFNVLFTIMLTDGKPYPLLQSQEVLFSNLLCIKFSILHFYLGISLLQNLCQKQGTLESTNDQW